MATASSTQPQTNHLNGSFTDSAADLLTSTLRNNFYEHNDISKSVNDIPGMTEDEERNTRVLGKMRQFIEKYQSIEHMLPPLDLSKVAEYSCSGILSKDELKMFMQPGISPITCSHPDAPKLQGDEMEVGADLAAMLLVQVKILQQRAILSEDRANLTEQELVEVNLELKRAYQRYEELHSSQQQSQDQVWDLELHIQDLNSQIDTLLTSNKDITEENKAISKRLEKASDTIHHLKSREADLTDALDTGMKKYNRDTQNLRQTILKMHEDLNTLERENSTANSPTPSSYAYSNHYESDNNDDMTFPMAPLPLDPTPINVYKPSPLKKERESCSSNEYDEEDELHCLDNYRDYQSRSRRNRTPNQLRRPSKSDSGYGDSSSRIQCSDSDHMVSKVRQSSRDKGFRLSEMPLKQGSNSRLDSEFSKTAGHSSTDKTKSNRRKSSYNAVDSTNEDWRHFDHQSNRLDSPAFTPRPTQAKINKKDRSHRYSMPVEQLENEGKLSKKEKHRLEAVSRLNNNTKANNPRHSRILHSPKRSNQSNESHYNSAYYTPETHFESDEHSEEYSSCEDSMESEDELQRFQRRTRRSSSKNKSKRQSTYQLRTYELVLPEENSKGSKSNQLKAKRASVITFLDPKYQAAEAKSKRRMSKNVVNLKGGNSKVASRIFSMGEQLLLQEIVQVSPEHSHSEESDEEPLVVLSSSKLNSGRSTPFKNGSRVTSPLRSIKGNKVESLIQPLKSGSSPSYSPRANSPSVMAKVVSLKPQSESDAEEEQVEAEVKVNQEVVETVSVAEPVLETVPLMKHQVVTEQSIISLKEALNTPLPKKVPNLTSNPNYPRSTTLNSVNSVPNLSKSTPLSQISTLPPASLKSLSTESFKVHPTQSASSTYRADDLEPIPTIGQGQGYLADVAVSIQVTMQGQFLYKSQRSLLGKEQRKLKFCWINPQQKYLYWSDVDPGTQRSLFMSGNSSRRNGCRSAFIRSIRMVPDSWTPTLPEQQLPSLNSANNLSPLGIGPNSSLHLPGSVPPLCLIIETPTKDIKLKAQDENMHNIWELALTYLQSTVPTSLSNMSNQSKPSLDVNSSTSNHTRNPTANSSIRTSNLSIHDNSIASSEANSFHNPGVPATYQTSYATQLSVSGIQRGLFIPTPTKNKRRSVFSNRGHW